MKPAPFDYVAPASVEQAVDHLAQAGADALVLAGGQTLMPMLALRLSTPRMLIDINRIAALKGIAKVNGKTRIAAVTRQNDVLSDGMLAGTLPVLVQATRHVGHHQTRNRGTVGGSISLGEPAAELPATAVALGASIEAHSKRGVRHIAADAFYTGPYTTVLEPDELVTAIHFPDWPPGTVPIFREIARRPGDFAMVGLVGAVAMEQGKIVRAGLAWFGMGPTPIKARQAEAALTGKRPAEIDINSIASDVALSETDPGDDDHATAEYRRSVGRHIFATTLSAALQARAAA